MKQLHLILIIILFVACGGNDHKQKDTTPPKKETISLKVVGMTCLHCENTIENSIKTLSGVYKVKANFSDSTTIVEFDLNKTNEEEIRKTISKKGYQIK